MKASIDKNACIGCNLCVDTCPEIFRIAGDGLAEVYAEPTSEIIEKAKDAAEDCPVSCIIVKE